MKYPALRLKNATIENVDDIVEINNSFLEYNPNMGLIISKLENNLLKEHILSKPDSISVAITSDNIIAGFIELSFSVDVDVIKKLEWLDENLRTKFENSEKLYIEKIAVKQEYHQQNLRTWK